MRKIILFGIIFLIEGNAMAQRKARALFPPNQEKFTHADTLRGSMTPERIWWDVTFYDLHVKVNASDSSLSGYNGISYVVKSNARRMQIDLMTPLVVDSMLQQGRSLRFRRDGNALFVTLQAPQNIGSRHTLTVFYHGKPRVAVRAPWDGGFVWTRDSLGNPWMATACQGIGASIWWPNKDTQADEPDSQRIAITVPDTLVDVSNGRLRSVLRHPDGTATFEWFVENPINNYDVAVNAGKYVHFADRYAGEKGPLSLDYWVLPYHLAEARIQFRQVPSMLKCFEYWFGPYPWYKDGYKLVEAPYLGMEHQSCVAYGNRFRNGYLGNDLSNTGWGLKWDFIIVHESAHEWFGNNITSKDLADMWIHESFANYAESLYTECLFGKKAGEAYCIGNRDKVINDKPIVAHYGVNEEGSEDMYYKGGNMLMTIRSIIGNDEAWRGILRGLNETFWHQTVTGRQIENYISSQAHLDLTKIFEQYLTTTHIPRFEYYIQDNKLHFRWSRVVKGFDMPLDVTLSNKGFTRIRPTEQWQTASVNLTSPKNFKADKTFYVEVYPTKR